ncbi:hypothetical protein U1Q18_049850 [Sarracenia purpurea var. burkii]
MQCELIKDPTLKPADPFSASIDAGVFRKEIIEDAATNRDKLVKIWFHRTFEQRHQIEDEYNKKCTVYTNGYYTWWEEHCPLSTGLKDISDDTMCDLYVDSLLSPENLLGKTAHEAIMDKWKEKGAIEEIVCGNDKEMKDKINRFYQEEYKDTVANQLATFRTDDKDYQHVMQLCWKGLCQDKKIKPEDADKEAEALRAIDLAKDKEGFKKKLNELLDKNCEPDMKLIFEKYRKDNCNIVDSVEKAYAGCDRVERGYNRLGIRLSVDTSNPFDIFACELIKDPTLKPADPFSASVDAGVFRKEIIEDAATNRDKLVKIWFHRTFEQRHQIEDEYNKKCTVYTNGYYTWWEEHCPLSRGLKDISDDTMCDLYVDSLLSPENLLGKTAHEAIMDKWKEKGAIEEIVCGNDKEMKDKINRFYQEGR